MREPDDIANGTRGNGTRAGEKTWEPDGNGTLQGSPVQNSSA